MSTTEDLITTADEKQTRGRSRRTRIDGAHELVSELPAPIIAPSASARDSDTALALLEVEEPSPEILAAVAGETIEARQEHLRLEVAQLAEHLRERLKEADRREAQLNARFAQLDGELRASRVWIRERELEFQDRETQLTRQVAELQERETQRVADSQDSTPDEQVRAEQLAERQRQLRALEQHLAERAEQVEQQAALAAATREQLSHQEALLDARQTQLSTQQSQWEEEAAALALAQQSWSEQRLHDALELTRQQQELARERDDLARQRDQFNHARHNLAHHQDAVDAQREQLATTGAELTEKIRQEAEAREQHLEAGETLLAEHARELDRDRATLVADRRHWEEECSRHQQTLQDREQAAQAELAERRQRLAARQDWIEQQRQSLEQVRGEIVSVHRQSLEMRLIAEQLWSQITGRLTPTEVTHAIAQLRAQLTDQYRLDEQDLQTRRDEIMQLSERIAGQHRELTQLRAGLREWTAARQEEIEQQARSLVQRELMLDQQQEEIAQSKQHWHAERLQYERQIRDLTRQLRSLPAAA